MPELKVSYGDGEDLNVYIEKLRPLYLDMLTKPGSLYQAMNVEITVPDNDGVPFGKICKIELVHAGKYSKCIENQGYDIEYYQRYKIIFFLFI